MATYEDMMNEIIKVQTKIIGQGIAIHLARGVEELVIDEAGRVVSYKGDPVNAIGKLVERYSKVERGVAITFAKKAIKPILEENPHLEIPAELGDLYTTKNYLRAVSN
jgi:hypothetical protein